MGTLSEAYKDHPVNLQHIVPLDFSSIQTVPDTHVWPSSDYQFSHISSSKIHHHDNEKLSIPEVNLMHPEAAELVCHACETWGMFQLTNHGVPISLLDEVELEARKLFSLPSRQKINALRSPGGATGFGIARISPFFPKYMWHEGFTIMGSPLDHAKELWPRDYLKFCNVMEEYQNKMKKLSEHLTKLVLKSLNTSLDHKTANWAEGACTALQLNSYPACPNPEQAMGLAPHTDTFLFTILHQSINACGLQLFKDNIARWVNVVPKPGALVVNVGDLLHILSNARFPSVVHRVVVDHARHRVSAAFFYGPPIECKVGPLVVGENKRYRDVAVKEYVGLKAESLEKALDLIRI